MEQPGYDTRDHDREYGVDDGVGNVVAPAERVLRAQVEDAVRAQCRRRAIVQVEEPYRAVHYRKTYGENGVHRPYGQAVEGELQRLLRPQDYLPADVECCERGQRHRKQRGPIVS